MFKSATLQLTAWYLAVLMVISLSFSGIIYQINFHEIDTRLQNLQESVVEILPGVFVKSKATSDLNATRNAQASEASKQLLTTLGWINLGVLIFGGLASYIFARKTLEPIERAHLAQSRFTSDASHELKTPLATMKIELESSIADKSLSLPEAREVLESNLEEVEKLIKISEMLLELSKLEDAKIKKTSLNLSKLTSEFLRTNPDKFNRVNLKAPQKAQISGNETAMKEVLEVLLENALTYSPEGAPIDIKISNSGIMVKFEISNKSEAVPQEQLDKLFDRFYRVDKSRVNTGVKNYGLGLSIAKKIIENHDGNIVARYKNNKFSIMFTILQHKK